MRKLYALIMLLLAPVGTLLAQTCTATLRSGWDDSIVTGFEGGTPANTISLSTNTALGDLVVISAWCDDVNHTVGGCTPISLTMGSNSVVRTSVAGARGPQNSVSGDAGTGQGWIYYVLSATAANQTITFNSVETLQLQVSYLDFHPSAGCKFVHNVDSVLGSGQSGTGNEPFITPAAGDVLYNFTWCSTHCQTPIGSPWTAPTWPRTGFSFLENSANAIIYDLSAPSGATANSVGVLNGGTATWQTLITSFSMSPQNTYYISKSTGLDSRTAAQAQSKSTPWAHLPGMHGATGAASSYAPAPGDHFILMGCDVWVNADLPVGWDWSGASGNPIYIGVDKTWHNTTNCPTGWNRPVFDGQNLAMTQSLGHGNSIFVAAPSTNTSYVTLDNIEMKRMGGTGASYVDQYNLGTNWILSNLYLHAWNTAADDCIIVQFKTPSLFTLGIIDGSDSTGAAAGHSCYGFYSTPPSITNSVIHDLVNPIVGRISSEFIGTPVEWGGNHLYNVTDSFQGANHCNIMEIVAGGTYYVHDNVMHDIFCAGGESMMLGNTGETSYIWNNIIYNLGSAQVPSTPQVANQTGMSLYFFNNTIVSPNKQSCLSNSNQSSPQYNNLVMQNNHCVTTGALLDGGWSVTNLVTTPNLLQTPTQAAANSSPKFDQYATSQGFVYSPTASTNSTVGAGTNLTSTATGNLVSLKNDTTYACTQQTINGVVQAVCPKRTSSARPASGAWDVGAYQFSGSQVQAPQAPTNLQAKVQ
jgi:hypothetical protein